MLVRGTMKKLLIFMLVGAMLLFTFVGCSNSNTSTESDDKGNVTNEQSKTDKKEDSKPQEKQVAKVISWWDFTKSDSLQQLKSKFEELNPEIELEFINVGSGYADKVLTMIAGGGDLPDVMMLAMDKIPMFAKEGAILSVDQYMTDDYKNNLYPVVMEALTYEGKSYAVARDVTSNVMYLNKKLFADANVELPNEDWTWNDFREIAKKLTKKDANNNPQQWGFYFPKYPDGYYYWLIANGGGLTTPDGRQSRMGDTETREAFKFLSDLINVDKVVPTEAQAQQFGKGATAPFVAQKVAMMVGGLSASVSMQQGNVDYAIRPLPTGKIGKKISHAFVNAWTIPKGAKNPDLSWKVMEFFSSKEGQQIVLNSNMGLPANKGVTVAEFVAQHPDNQVFIDALGYSAPFQKIEYANDFFSLLKAELDFVWLGEKSVDEVIDSIEKSANDKLAGK